jgi:hypothetical protein
MDLVQWLVIGTLGVVVALMLVDNDRHRSRLRRHKSPRRLRSVIVECPDRGAKDPGAGRQIQM